MKTSNFPKGWLFRLLLGKEEARGLIPPPGIGMPARVFFGVPASCEPPTGLRYLRQLPKIIAQASMKDYDVEVYSKYDREEYDKLHAQMKEKLEKMEQMRNKSNDDRY